MDVISTFARASRRSPDRVFLIDAASTMSYREADERSNAVAANLADRGVAPDDTVGLCASDRVSMWVAVLGAWKCGALPALIDPLLGDDDLPYFLEDIGARLIAAAPEQRPALERCGASAIVDLDSLGDGDSAVVNRHGPHSPLYLSYTSGTTGAPKGVVLRSGEVTLATSCIADRLGLSKDDTLLATTPIPSSFQLIAALLPAIHTGSAVALVSGRPVSEMWKLAKEVGANVLVAYPLTLADVVNAPEAQEGSPFRVAMSGGSPLAPRIKRDYLEKLGIPLLETYGQSELGGFMAMGSPSDGSKAMEGYVGRSLPDRLSYIGGTDNAELAAGEVGEVMVTHGYFLEYRNKPEKFAESTLGGVLHTGDLAVSDEDGYFKVLGRVQEASSAARRGGFLRELEDALYSHPSVLHAAVVETEDGALAGFYESLVGANLEPDDLLRHAGGLVSESLLPKTMTEVDSFPRTFSGKANRLELARRASEA